MTGMQILNAVIIEELLDAAVKAIKEGGEVRLVTPHRVTEDFPRAVREELVERENKVSTCLCYSPVAILLWYWLHKRQSIHWQPEFNTPAGMTTESGVKRVNGLFNRTGK